MQEIETEGSLEISPAFLQHLLPLPPHLLEEEKEELGFMHLYSRYCSCGYVGVLKGYLLLPYHVST